MTVVGTYRGLQRCSDSRGVFNILAIDHRANLVADMQKHRSAPVEYGDVLAFKRAVIRNLADMATAILVDPDYGLPALPDISPHLGVLAPLEVTNYTIHPSERAFKPIPGWDARRLRQAGIEAAKLLIYYHPDAANAQAQTAIVDDLIRQCQQAGVPLFLEPVTFSPDPARALTGDEKARAVIATAQHFTDRGAAILKLEFPGDLENESGWSDALAELNAVCTVPWALLSAGVPFEVFERQADAACKAGASGVIAGRAIWAESLSMADDARDHWLATTGRERMRRLGAICARSGHDWRERVPPPTFGEGWYRDPGA